MVTVIIVVYQLNCIGNYNKMITRIDRFLKLIVIVVHQLNCMANYNKMITLIMVLND